MLEKLHNNFFDKSRRQQNNSLSNPNETYPPKENYPLSLSDTVKNVCAGNYKDKSLELPMKYLADQNYRFSKDELKELISNPINSYVGNTIAHKICFYSSYIFSFDEIMIMENRSNKLGQTIGHILAGKCPFSAHQILEMRDTKDKFGDTISIIVARNGNSFSFSDIQKLGNPADFYGITLGHLSFEKTGFSVNELIKLGNPADKDGDTIAHLMAKNGHIFSDVEIDHLGNPMNNSGYTISQIMSLKGNEPNSSGFFLDLKNLAVSDAVWFWDFHCDIYINGLLTLYWTQCDPIEYKIFNQELYENLLSEFKNSWFSNSISIKWIEKSKIVGYPDFTERIIIAD